MEDAPVGWGGPVTVGFGWGGPMTLVGNFMQRSKGSGYFVRNKLK
jgi:hypothetical protein